MRNSRSYRPRRHSAKKSFRNVFEGVSTIVQRQLVEQALIPFLDTLPRSDARRVISKAKRIAKKAESMPQLDLAAKKTEVNGLLDELAKDSKAFTRQNSGRYETLVREVVESVTEWLNYLWIITFEYGIDFPRAHSCLLFSMGVLDHIQGMKNGGCRCAFSSIYVPITIKDSNGVIVNEFLELGLANVETAIIWVWREVFVALLASGSPTYIKLMPELLAEIDDIIGWTGLERVILGGTTFADSFPREKERPSDHVQLISHCDRRALIDTDIVVVSNNFHECHWSSKHHKCLRRLRKLVQNRMIEIFKAYPSVALYIGITFFAIGNTVVSQLDEILALLAPTSATSLATAIQIYAFNKKPDEIAELLNAYAFLLRPRDAEALQYAARALAGSLAGELRILALHLVEKELVSMVCEIRHALRGPFCQLDAAYLRAEFFDIARLPLGETRAERVEQWVDRATTPGLGSANPMAFAAMMMGLPLPAGLDLDEIDQMGFIIDLDPHDPDFLDLREEYRPDLKGRFDSWVETTEGMSGASTTLKSVYRHIHEAMPWIVCSDIVDEMIAKIADKPSKHYICDALESLAAFAKSQMGTPSTQDDNAEGEDVDDEGYEEDEENNNNGENEEDSDEEPEPEALLPRAAEPDPNPLLIPSILDLD